MTDIPILTSPVIEGLTIMEYKGLVTARNVRGINVVRDLLTAFRDVFGGRSGSYEEVMADMEREVLSEIQAEACRLGANAVVAFSLDFDNIGSKGKSLIMAYGRGTAVVLQ
ncbi:MAG: YbjQ family protein [Verrucomicrobia bacterium]|nr:YbjQ family protein [Verrucomicrobiota bacterium]MDA1087893.1 YbjQ family protein [Verrucomicrobiota bacterium]